jgi:putative ABC transport system ATP-binding protein
VLDRAGRVQLPREMVEEHQMKDLVRLQSQADHISVWADTPAGRGDDPAGDDPAGRGGR